jgi:hypothetical protein
MWMCSSRQEMYVRRQGLAIPMLSLLHPLLVTFDTNPIHAKLSFSKTAHLASPKAGILICVGVRTFESRAGQLSANDLLP